MTSQPSRRSRRSTLPPDHVGILIGALLLASTGWGGLYLLVTSEYPRVGQIWLFFVLLHIAVSATVLPIVRYINVRLTPRSRMIPPAGVVIRQSIWIGLFAVACAWLQIPRALTPPNAFFIALAFLIVEAFLRLRELPTERR